MNYGKIDLDLSVQALPDTWEGFTREQKVQRLFDVVNQCLVDVRRGAFDPSDGDKVASLILEAQMELSTFFTDAEGAARNAKHIADFIEAEVSNKIAAAAEKKPSDATIKRKATASDEVKEAKTTVVENEKRYKKWRCVYEILREAHIMFRNISKLA